MVCRRVTLPATRVCHARLANTAFGDTRGTDRMLLSAETSQPMKSLQYLRHRYSKAFLALLSRSASLREQHARITGITPNGRFRPGRQKAKMGSQALQNPAARFPNVHYLAFCLLCVAWSAGVLANAASRGSMYGTEICGRGAVQVRLHHCTYSSLQRFLPQGYEL
jgi:hypothetical protein